MLIICNGMPRSGSTAVYNIVRQYLENTSTVQSLGFFDEDRLLKELNDLFSKCHSKRIYILKTHCRIPNKLIEAIKIGSAMEIYTIRNLRDIAVSMRRVWNFDDENIRRRIIEHSELSRHKVKEGYAVFARFEYIFQSDSQDMLRQVAHYLQSPLDAAAANNARAKIEAYASLAKSSIALKWKARWLKAIIAINSKVRVGRILKRIFPESVVQSLKQTLFLIDRKTLMHPGHTSILEIRQGDVDIGDKIANEFRDWQREFNYE